MHINFFLAVIGKDFGFILCFCLFKCNRFSQVFVFICRLRNAVKSEDIAVTHTVGNRIPCALKFIAEYISCGGILFLVDFKNRSARKTYENRAWECVFYRWKHTAEYTSVALVNDENNTLVINFFNIIIVYSVFCLDTAHFLNRGYNQSVAYIITFQLGNQHFSIFSWLNVICFIGKTSVFTQRLHSKFNSVHKENYLVGILGICNKLCGFETCHGLTRTGCVPYITAVNAFIVPLHLTDTTGNLTCSIILIASHNFKCVVGLICNRIETYHLVRHRNWQKPLGNHIPIINRIVIFICPMKAESFSELIITSWVGKIGTFFGIHCNKHLHKWKQPRKHTFVEIFTNLILCFTDRYVAFFQFNVNDRHSVNQQTEIAAAIGINAVLRLEFRLLCNLITSSACGYFIAVKDFERYRLLEIVRVIFVVTDNLHSSAINKSV